MISVFLREQKRYTQEDLVKEFQCSEEKAVRILKRLKEYSVLKAVKANDTQKDLTDLLDEDIEIADVEVGENEYLYVFTFVGVITIEGRVLSNRQRSRRIDMYEIIVLERSGTFQHYFVRGVLQ